LIQEFLAQYSPSSDELTAMKPVEFRRLIVSKILSKLKDENSFSSMEILKP